MPAGVRPAPAQAARAVITWDEGSTNLGGGATVISPHVRAGFRSATSPTPYSTLRTIEDAWGLGCLYRTCVANDMREFFTR